MIQGPILATGGFLQQAYSCSAGLDEPLLDPARRLADAEDPAALFAVEAI
jgi:hypothetical protein